MYEEKQLDIKVMILRNYNKTIKIKTLFILALMFHFPYGLAWSIEEIPMQLPKAEGSKNFDLEIDQLNNRGIGQYKNGNYGKASNLFKKATKLAKQFRDPSQGVLHYNLALSLNKLQEHEKAIKQFYLARRYARGNHIILKSRLLKLYECGLNPSVTCDEKIPLPLNIEGSH